MRQGDTLTEQDVFELPNGSEIEVTRMLGNHVLVANKRYTLRKVYRHGWHVCNIQAQYETNPVGQDWSNPTLVSTPIK